MLALTLFLVFIKNAARLRGVIVKSALTMSAIASSCGARASPASDTVIKTITDEMR